MGQTDCGIYVRISQDRAGSRLGVERQREDCEKLAAERGWRVIERYVDNDVSAYSGRERPAWNRLVEDLKVGRVQALIAWHPDRLYRRMTDLESLVNLLEHHKLTVVTVQAGDVDLASTQGRLVARLAGAVAAHESEHKSERITRKHQELAEKGWWKGGPRPFGYRPIGGGQLELIPEEAGIIRETADRVLAGENVHRLSELLNQRGVVNASGAAWHPSTLKHTLTSATTAGQREYHGKVIGAAVWEPILDQVTSGRVRVALTGPSRVAPARVSWLNGLLVCGVCSKPLRSMRRDNGARTYACPPGPVQKGCGRIQANATPVDHVVSEALFAALDSPALAARAHRTDRPYANVVDIGELESQLADLAASWAEGALSKIEWQAARPVLQRRIDQARAEQLAGASSSALLPYVGPGVLRAAWEDLSLDQRRTVAGAVIDHVTVKSAVKRGRNFDPARLELVWRA